MHQGTVDTASIKVETTSNSDYAVESAQAKDYDTRVLEELGYKQEFTREVSLMVQAGFAFSTMAVLPNWLVNLTATMSAGGPMSLFWGIVSNND